ncbi:hypothetical protein AAMO2058_001510900 [Amorphochlora amoebiformis]
MIVAFCLLISGLYRVDSQLYATKTLRPRLSRLLRPSMALRARPNEGEGAPRRSNPYFKKGGVVYIEDFLPREKFEKIQEEVSRLEPDFRKEVGSIARGREGMVAPKNSCVHSILTSKEVTQQIVKEIGTKVFPADFPIEIRRYTFGGRMRWHEDDILYAKPQFEAILTVENKGSLSKTEWFQNDGTISSVSSRPNSLLVIKAGEIRHRVTPVLRGRRTIVKCIFTTTLKKAPDFQDQMPEYN